jgi:hypothetical protein
MPFSTCSCVFRLPAELASSAETIYRNLAGQVFPEIASDEIWEAGLRRATAAWTLHAMTTCLSGPCSPIGR